MDEIVTRVRVPHERPRLLDFGSSIPVLPAAARERGVQDAVGVDQAAHEFGRAHGFTMLMPRDVDGAVADGSLDVIRFLHALEHVPDPRQVFRALAAKLRPGGMAYITQPSFPLSTCDPSPVDLLDMVYPGHLHFFSPISLMEMVTGAGLQIPTFFTHEKAEEVQARHRAMLDLDVARGRLASVKSLEDAAFGPLNNFPYYLGQNSVVWALRPSENDYLRPPASRQRRWRWWRV